MRKQEKGHCPGRVRKFMDKSTQSPPKVVLWAVCFKLASINHMPRNSHLLWQCCTTTYVTPLHWPAPAGESGAPDPAGYQAIHPATEDVDSRKVTPEAATKGKRGSIFKTGGFGEISLFGNTKKHPSDKGSAASKPREPRLATPQIDHAASKPKGSKQHVSAGAAAAAGLDSVSSQRLNSRRLLAASNTEAEQAMPQGLDGLGSHGNALLQTSQAGCIDQSRYDGSSGHKSLQCPSPRGKHTFSVSTPAPFRFLSVFKWEVRH